jgi:hypothetical protein
MTMVRCVYYETIQCMIAISKGLCAHGLPHKRFSCCNVPDCKRDGDFDSRVFNCACIEVKEDETEETSEVYLCR